jgi:hypothetical protein
MGPHIFLFTDFRLIFLPSQIRLLDLFLFMFKLNSENLESCRQLVGLLRRKERDHYEDQDVGGWIILR